MANESSPISRGSTVLLIDPRIVDTVVGADLVLGAISKHPQNPLFGEDYFAVQRRPWETRFDNVYPNIVRDPESGLFRVWYFSFLTDSDMADIPLAERPSRTYSSPDREDGLLYAESTDGIHWTKPDLGLIDFQGSRANNIVMSTQSHGIHSGGVLRDEHETDPDRRYKMIFRSRRERAMAVSFSPDGLDWSEPVLWADHNAVGDTHTNGFWDPLREKYVVVTRAWTQSTPENLYQGQRIVVRTESADFLTWTQPTEVLRGANEHDQIYSMPIAPYRDIYVGLPAVFHKGDQHAPDWDLVDTELAFSLDTEHWWRAKPGSGFIPHGEGTYPTGSYDCGCIYASTPIIVDDEVWIYYGGSNGTHNGFRESSLNLATLPIDRWAGYSVGPSQGHITTSPVRFDGSGLSLNAAVAQDGSVRVALLDASGVAIDGFSFDACESIEGDGVRLPVAWSTDVATLGSRVVRLVVELQNASLFAINGVTRFES